MGSMSFNKENLVGVAQKSTSANNYEESRASNASLDIHTQNKGIHITFEDRKRWDEQPQYLKDYIDYRFKSIIGKFKFDVIGISNKRTLVDIILYLYNNILSKFNKESVEYKYIINTFIDKIERVVEQDMMSRQLEIRATLELIDELNEALSKEAKERKDNDDLEIKIRQSAINEVLNYINEQVASLQQADQSLKDKIEQEVIDRADAIEEFEKRYTKAMNQYAVELQTILSRMEELISGSDSKLKQLESRIVDLETTIHQSSV